MGRERFFPTRSFHLRGCALRRLAASMAALVTMTGVLFAENRALLVAVPNTPYLGPDGPDPLEGPSNDVVALRRTLVDHWGFRDDRIRTLDGSDSTRTAILAALDRLADESSEGDHVLVYFSGHGTSAFSIAGLPRDTGALVPADIKLGSDKEMIEGLIVGSRDLRPRFERIDRAGAETLVLFDACYSGDSAKSFPRLVARSTELFPRRSTVEVADLIGDGSADTQWPYDSVIYISASARHELARDIGAREARSTAPTIDGLAHGAFTDGLLRALNGEADRDRDGQIVYSELHEYLIERVLRYGQTPRLHSTDKLAAEQPVFGQAVAPERPLAPVKSGSLRVRLSPPDPELRTLLEGQDGLVVTAGVCDLEVRRERRDRFRVYAAGADLGVYLTDRSEVVALLKGRVLAQQIANLEFPAQDMRLAILVEPEQGGVYYLGEKLDVGVRLGEPAWLLLLAIDSHGGVLAVYPADRSQAQPAGGAETVRVVRLGVTAPFGTDLLEAFAFHEKPEGYDEWIGRAEPLGQADTHRLYEMLRKGSDQPGRGRASRILFTLGR